jgi:hypothetical protein
MENIFKFSTDQKQKVMAIANILWHISEERNLKLRFLNHVNLNLTYIAEV